MALQLRNAALDWQRGRLDEVMASGCGEMLLCLLWAVVGCPLPWPLPAAYFTAPHWSLEWRHVVMKLLLTKHLSLNYRPVFVAQWNKTVNTQPLSWSSKEEKKKSLSWYQQLTSRKTNTLISLRLCHHLGFDPVAKVVPFPTCLPMQVSTGLRTPRAGDL